MNRIDSFRRKAGALTGGAAGAYFALIVLLALCALTNETFRNPQNLANIARQVTAMGVISLGMTFVIVGGGIDLSVGSLFAFSGVISVLSIRWTTLHPELFGPFFGTHGGAFLTASVVSLAVGAAGGALNGFLIVIGRIPPFIATLGTLSIFRSLAQHLAHAGSLAVEPDFSELADPYIARYPLAPLALLALTALLAVLMKNTAFGRHVCAVGSNVKVARYAGIRTGLVTFATYGIVGLCVGAAMVLHLGQYVSVANDTGNMYELDAIAAVVIGGGAMSGGKGSLWGTLAGVLILGIVSNILDLWGTASTLKGLVKGGIILFSVFIQRKEKA